MKRKLFFYILIVFSFIFLNGCFSYSVRAEKIMIDESSIPKEVTVDDFVLSDIKLIVARINGTTDEVPLNETMLNSDALKKLNSPGSHTVYVRYDGKIAVLHIELLKTYPNVRVVFETNGGTEIKSQFVEKNTKALRPSEPSREGYNFAGWYYDKDFVRPFLFSNIITGNTTIYAKWDSKVNIITYETNGGSRISNLSVLTGETISKVIPTREGYNFVNWYTDNDFTQEYDFSKKVNSSFTLYAKWSPVDCLIKFETNGGNKLNDLKTKYDSIEEFPTPVYEGYTFIGWYTDSALTNKFDTTSLIKGSYTLYAKWEEAKFIITFETNGGSKLNDIIVNYKDKLLTNVIPEKEDCVFVGWFLDSELKKPFDSQKVITENLKLYAKWDIRKITVRFETNNGASVSEKLVPLGSLLDKPNTPNRSGYKFIGWFSDSAFEKQFDFNTPITKEITLYAKWEPKEDQDVKHTVKIIDDDLQVIMTLEVNDYDTLSNISAPQKENYVFDNWYSDKSFSSIYDMSTPITFSREVYAHYVDELTVTFVGMNNEVIGIVKVGYGHNVVAPTVPTIEGYTFEKWNGNLEEIKFNTTIKAQYKQNSYNIKFMCNGNIASTQIVLHGNLPLVPTNQNRYAPLGTHFVSWDKNISVATSDIVYVAVYEANVYSVKFVDVNDNVLFEQELKYGSLVSIPSNIIDEYYLCNKWYTSKDLITEYSFNKAINSDLTIYGKLELVPWITISDNTIINIDCKDIEELVIPSKLNNITFNSVLKFTNTENCKKIVIPETILNIDLETLVTFKNLESIIVEEGNKVYSSVDGVLYNKDQSELIYYPAKKELQEFVTLDSVKTIASNAFANCYYLNTLTLKNIDKLSHTCFKNSNIMFINIKKENVLKENDTFSYISELKVIVLAEYYDEYKSNWNDIISILYSTNELYDGYLIRAEEDNITISKYIGSKEDIIIPESINGKKVTKVLKSAFDNKNIKSIVFPKTLTVLEEDALKGLELRYVIFNSSLTISDEFANNIKQMLVKGKIYVLDEALSSYTDKFTDCYPLSMVSNDYSFIIKDNKYGILQYLGSSNELTLPTKFLDNDVTFIDELFINGLDINVIYANSFYSFSLDTISNKTYLVVKESLYETYIDTYPNIMIFNRDIPVKENDNFVYGISNDEIIIIKVKNLNGLLNNGIYEVPNTIDNLLVTSISKGAFAGIDHQVNVKFGESLKNLSSKSLCTKEEYNNSFIFSSLNAPIVDGKVCYDSDKIYKTSYESKNYGITFSNHTVIVYGSVVKENNSYRYAIYDKKVTIMKYILSSSDYGVPTANVVIPASIDRLEVVEISAYAFYGEILIKTISVPESIKNIGYLAFGNLINLKEVTIDSKDAINIEKRITNSSALVRVPDASLLKYRSSDAWKYMEVIAKTSKVMTNTSGITYVIEDGKALILDVNTSERALTFVNGIDGIPIKKLGAYSLYNTEISVLNFLCDVELISYYALPDTISTLEFRGLDAIAIYEQEIKTITVYIDSLHYSSFVESEYWQDYTIVKR